MKSTSLRTRSTTASITTWPKPNVARRLRGALRALPGRRIAVVSAAGSAAAFGPITRRPPVAHHTLSYGDFLMARIIEVTVSPQGETTIQTKGYAGSDCLQASKWLEQVLGIATADRRTAEFYQSAQTEQNVRQQ